MSAAAVDGTRLEMSRVSNQPGEKGKCVESERGVRSAARFPTARAQRVVSFMRTIPERITK
jgi:hypothetical protein